MTENLVILGSTGSIGTQALDVCKNLNIQVVGLAAHSNTDLLEDQIREFSPAMAGVFDVNKGKDLQVRVADTNTRVVYGTEGINELVTYQKADTVLTSVVGTAGLLPTMAAIHAGKTIALANKETLVTAGSLVMKEAAKHKVSILPVDSEHSALFQCLAGNRNEDVSKMILTASGGPFRGFTAEQLLDVTRVQALRHPNWSMGSKITIDSATMMNKGLEVIEARWLYNLPPDAIEVLIHPQSIVHSMVEFKDGSVMAQLGAPDMRIPIQLALTWPERHSNAFHRLDLSKTGILTFEKPDFDVFRCLSFAYEALKTGGTMPAVMNAANEIAVSMFLQDKISFSGIMKLIETVMSRHTIIREPSLGEILESDRWARIEAEKPITEVIQ